MKAHPESKRTLRECWELFYPKDELAPRTVAKVHYTLARWEKLMDDPIVGLIDHIILEQFRSSMLKEGYAPKTINSAWMDLRTILRRIGPSAPGNPFGLGIIDSYPAMRPVKDPKGDPQIISQEDLAKVYIAARHMEFPRRRSDLPPADWWRALITTAYCTGLRRGTLWDLTNDQIDLKAGTVAIVSSKTGKSDLIPLHPVAVEHLGTIQRPHVDRVFRGMFSSGNGAFYKLLRQLQDIAKIEPFTLQALRRTGATMLESVSPGMGPLLLQHTARSVSDIHYLNRSIRLREALEKLPIPPGWKSGIKVNAKRQAEQRRQAVEMVRADFIVPDGPNPADWKFHFGQFAYRGEWYPLHSPFRLTVLQMLCTHLKPVSCEELIHAVTDLRKSKYRHYRSYAEMTIRGMHNIISGLRRMLKKYFGLGSWDPLPCTSRGTGGAWTISLPADVNRKQNAS